MATTLRLKWVRRTLLSFLFFTTYTAAQVPIPVIPQPPAIPRQAELPVVQTELPGVGSSGSGTRGAVGGSTPEDKPTPGVLDLSIADAIDRGLRRNLGLILGQQSVQTAEAGRLAALSALLPHLRGSVAETSQQVNLRAFGVDFPGVNPIVGPFQVFDARASATQAILDLSALSTYRANEANVTANQYILENARQAVTLLVVNLYLEALAWQSRIASREAQVRTAEATFKQATDMRQSGLVAGIDVLRTQVELQAEQQQLIAARAEFQRSKLDLARAIGLALGQEFRLSDSVPAATAPGITVEEALRRAYTSRADYQAALAALKAANQQVVAARRRRLPTLYFDGNYGTIGPGVRDSHGTFAATVAAQFPIFEGGRIRAEEERAAAMAQQRTAEASDLRGRIDYDVRTALLDLQSSAERVQVAQSAVGLAQQQLQQSTDRFQAGVTNSLEVVQSQQAVITADDNVTNSLYLFNLAKAALVRAMGLPVPAARDFLGVRAK